MMGSELDAAKTVSSLTLFEAAGLESAAALLGRIGRRCARTLEMLELAATCLERSNDGGHESAASLKPR